MASRYVRIDATQLKEFINKLSEAGKTEFKKELAIFLEGIADDFLRIVEDEIIRLKTVDTGLLLNSFQRGDSNNVYVLEEGNLTIEVGTNVTYASYVNDGHWTNPKGVATRWVPGYWNGEHFIYQPGAKTGMLLKQKWVEGSHYFDNAIRGMEQMIPGLLETKLQQWADKYFSM